TTLSERFLETLQHFFLPQDFQNLMQIRSFVLPSHYSPNHFPYLYSHSFSHSLHLLCDLFLSPRLHSFHFFHQIFQPFSLFITRFLHLLRRDKKEFTLFSIILQSCHPFRTQPHNCLQKLVILQQFLYFFFLFFI